jgi:uncharacterized protein (TIGR00162 family)
MVCKIQIYEKPRLNKPILIEGLPGIGFVASIAALHLIQELKAKPFAEIRSSSFQDFAITAGDGKARFPTSELYYHKGREKAECDLIILHGNTQALTTFGQYELCGHILNIARDLGCQYVVTLGGLRREDKVSTPPKLYCAASDTKTLKEALNLGAEIIEGQIFGVAGLLIGLSKFWNMRGFCLLAETPGFYPDAQAAREALNAVCKMLNLKVNMSRLEVAADTTREILESFGLITQQPQEKTREEPRWHI